jgi:hypothetical protein
VNFVLFCENMDVPTTSMKGLSEPWRFDCVENNLLENLSNFGKSVQKNSLIFGGKKKF